ncbi:GumC family protein [Flavisphingomonas formosensis]|uniref:GumC family protein n=1 Tax=Flavisphingomonas formosensis TaxID=861534 RepID=UPI0012F9E6C6|nr:polysaccharide biosynthesis tyrosine autokinase [Sphingomonas formosensis]
MTDTSVNATGEDRPWNGTRSYAGRSGYVDAGGDGDADEGGFSINVPLILGTLRRNAVPIAAIIAVCLLLGIVKTLLSTRIYRGSSVVQIEQQSANIVDTQSIESATPIADSSRFLQTQLAILNSRSLSERVAERLKLFNNSFLVQMGGSGISADPKSPQGQQTLRDAVVGQLRAHMSVDLPGNSRAATLSFDSPDPKLSATIANGYADAYIANNLERKFDSSAYARSFLAQQLVTTRQRLEDSERNAINYARDNGLIMSAGGGSATNGTDTTASGSLTTNTLMQLNSAYGDARTERIKAEQRWQAIQKMPLMDIPDVMSNAAIQSMLQKKADLRAQLQEQKQRYKSDHPTIVQLNAQIAEIDAQMTRMATDIKNGFYQTYQVALKQENSFVDSVSNARGDALKEQGKEIQLNILRREVDTNRTLYDGLLQRFKELSAVAGIESNNLSVIDRADVPKSPIQPKPLVNIAVALLVGVALAGLFVIGREMLDDAIRTPEDVRRKLGVPVLGTIPVLKGGQSAIDEINDPRSGLSEAYYSLRTALEFSTPEGLPRVLTFTSSRPSEGKSTSAIATAQNLARIGKKVLLVDADLRLPSLHRQLPFKNNGGFVSVLTNQNPLETVVQKSDNSNMDFLSSGPLPPNPTDLLTNYALQRFFQSALEHYDILIVDSPPVMGFADSLQISSMAEGVVFVIDSNVGHRGATKIALRRLAASHAPLLGILLTKFDAEASGYGYGYGYGYSYSYSYGNQPSKAS